MQINIHEIKTHLSGTLVRVEQGETITICRRNKPVAEIHPVRQPRRSKRPIGLAGQEYPDFIIGDEFFEPLPGDIMACFTGEKE